jgi:uncharacterized protein (TIGR00730 family)
MKRICVFCGSSPGAKNEYVQAAKSLGRELADRAIALVYGGATVGLMGQLANACLEAGGEVIGVIPQRLVEMEVAKTDLAQLHIVDSMHERKALMAELADGFIALPGGLGTIEEFFEALTWGQLGMHQKPCGLLNTCGFFDTLIAFVGHMVDQQFVERDHWKMIQIDESPARLLTRFDVYRAPKTDKVAWVLEMTEKMKTDDVSL